MAEQYVLVPAIADFIGISHSTLAGRLKKSGVSMVRIMHPSNGMLVFAVSVDDAKRIIEEAKNRPEVISPAELMGKE